ncbi:VOC family protein [Micromonospora sp. CPCC 206061]|uniref:VOC family protein n=1 Tax=Micromonospora sp. CPCC 206061 TaxID=3122410 RepID=UPI002FF0659D
MSAHFVWFDVTADDADRAREFYTSLFGWSAGDGAGGYSTWFSDGGQPWAGVAPAERAVPAGRWVPYVVVDDLDAATKRAVALGATVVAEATQGPGGTSVTITDPAGAHLALFVPRSS